MEAYKIAGGVAAGVGVVAALPVLGAIGSVSLLGAILGGTLGGVAGAVASEIEEDAQREDRSASVQEEEEPDVPNPWLLALGELQEKMENDESFGNLVLMLHTMGCAARRVEGFGVGGAHWVREIRDAIDALDLPEEVRKEIDGLSDQQVTMAMVATKVLALAPAAKMQLAELLKRTIPEEVPRENSLFRGSSFFWKVESNEVLELVKSLIEIKPSGDGE